MAKSKKMLEILLEEVGRTESKKNDNHSALIGEVLQIAGRHISALKELVITAGFGQMSEEITFFKYIKPQFISLQLYYLRLRELDLGCPAGMRAIRKFYLKELERIDVFFCENGPILAYYRSQGDEMDQFLFTRGQRPVPLWLVGERTDTDERFSCPADHLIAGIMAAEKLQSHILSILNGLESKAGPVGQPGPPHSLKWTGESINLVEIAYGIWLTGQINSGNASISEIVRWLESGLGVNIGRAYRRWTEISRRDTANTTKYLDRMREMIRTRLTDEDDLKRQKRNSEKK